MKQLVKEKCLQEAELKATSKGETCDDSVLQLLDLEWYIKLFLGVHFADNLACGHRGISGGEIERAKSPREIPLGVTPQMAHFWPLAEGPKCRQLP